MKPKITIAVLTTWERTGWVHPKILTMIEVLRRMETRGKLPFDYQFEPVHGADSATHKRNVVCEAFHKGQPEAWGDWLLMIDNDMEPPVNLMDMVLQAPQDASIVAPRMYFWDCAQGHETATLCWGISSNPDPETFGRIYQNKKGYTRLIKCGTGAIAIHRRVFDKIARPWFWRDRDPMTAQEINTEDVTFSLKVKNAGLKVYGCNFIEVGHYHNVNLSTVAKKLYDPVFCSEDRFLTCGLGEQQNLDNGVIINSSSAEECPSEVGAAGVSPTVTC